MVEDPQMEEIKRAASRMSSRHQPSHVSNLNAATLPVLPWLTPGAIHLPSGVEEVGTNAIEYGVFIKSLNSKMGNEAKSYEIKTCQKSCYL